MRTIYFDQKPLIITAKKDNAILQTLNLPGTVLVNEFNLNAITDLLKGLQEDVKAGIIVGDEESTLHFIKSLFTVVPAAGGLVVTPEVISL
jgi:hypothetical protein